MPNKTNWLPLFSTQFLGVLNDNFLKNCIIFVSIFWLAEDQQYLVISLSSALPLLPFILLNKTNDFPEFWMVRCFYQFADNHFRARDIPATRLDPF